MKTACKKEENKLNHLGSDIYLNGKVGDLYENSINGNKVFFIKEFTKANQRPILLFMLEREVIQRVK